jgi:RNA polymerase sigma factor (sigma-70 family)
MASEASTDVREAIQRLWDVGTLAGLTDRQLLDRFLVGPGEAAEAAFATLVERHGPSVRRVCAERLGDFHAAQDAAQASFLVLARKARSIRKPEALGSWLHGVALRVARRARCAAARRRAVENRRAEVMAGQLHAKQIATPESHFELYEEIERLPEKYKCPIVLCYFQGYTQEQAAEQLGWPLGTIQTRLHRGRERLRSRLTRRGLGFAGVTAGRFGLLANTPKVATIPPRWANATASAAVRFAAGRPAAGLVAPAVLELAEFAVTTLLMDSVKVLALLALAVSIASAGAGVTLRAVGRGRQPAQVARTPLLEAPVPAAAQREPHRPAPRSSPTVAATPVAQPAVLVVAQAEPAPPAPPQAAPAWPELDAAIQPGARFLKQKQRADGSWFNVDSEAPTGTTSLVTLALLAASEPPDAPTITRAVEFLRRSRPEQLKSTYAISLQTMVFAAVDPRRDQARIIANARWLEDAQIKPGDRVKWPGSWTYSRLKNRNGDNSNTHYALMGLKAASDAGVPIIADAWARARRYWEQYQRKDGGWAYTPDAAMPSSASMTCAGISSLIITGPRQTPALQRAVDWIGDHFQVGENFPVGQQWRYYYLADLEQAGRLTGRRVFGTHHWYREGTEKLLHEQDRDQGCWQGAGPVEGQEPVGLIPTSFALLFLARGRPPILIAPDD